MANCVGTMGNNVGEVAIDVGILGGLAELWASLGNNGGFMGNYGGIMGDYGKGAQTSVPDRGGKQKHVSTITHNGPPDQTIVFPKVTPHMHINMILI